MIRREETETVQTQTAATQTVASEVIFYKHCSHALIYKVGCVPGPDFN